MVIKTRQDRVSRQNSIVLVSFCACLGLFVFSAFLIQRGGSGNDGPIRDRHVKEVIASGVEEETTEGELSFEVKKVRFARNEKLAYYSAVEEWDLRLLNELQYDLTDQALATVTPGEMLEGFSAQLFEETQFYFLSAKKAQVKTICEIGFNAGHSAATFLTATGATRYYGFDLGVHHYAEPCFNLLREVFPGRMTMTWGDSVVTVPEFFLKNPDVTCDLIHIDGGHFSYTPFMDLKNMRQAASKNHVLLMDDLNCGESYCLAPTKAWKTAVARNWVHEIFCTSHFLGDEKDRGQKPANRGYCKGQYVL